MPDSRVVSRREPITTTVEDVGEFVAHPRPWRRRNDLGNLITKTLLAAIDAVQAAAKDPDDPEAFAVVTVVSGFDYLAVFRECYPDGDEDAFEKLDFPEMVTVLDAALEVNGLEGQQYMLDLDNRKNPNRAAAESAAEPTDETPRMESSPD